MSGIVHLSRRRFLQVMAAGTGALVVGVGTLRAQTDTTPLPLLGDNTTRLGPYIRIEPDGRTIIGARDPECGEGTHTSLPMIIADELDADWSRVTVLGLGPEVTQQANVHHWRYGHQRSGDGSSIPTAWHDLRQAGALARWLLRKTAARRASTAAHRLRSKNGQITTPQGKHIGYGELVGEAAEQSPPSTPPAPKTPDQYRLIGHGVGDINARDLVQGHVRNALDQYPADGLVAVIVHCPWPHGYLSKVDTDAALAIEGVERVQRLTPDPEVPLGETPIATGVAVLAHSTWAALKGRDKLKLDWQPGDHPEPDTKTLLNSATQKLDGDSAPTHRARHDGDPDAAQADAARRIKATYTQPFVAHATPEPINCIAEVTHDHARIIVPTQAPQKALAVVQRLTNLPPEKIDIQVPRAGGGLGRRLDHDVVAEAVMLAQAAGKPVKLMWTRGDDLSHDFYRPLAVHRLQVALDDDGGIRGWRQEMVSPSALWHRDTPRDEQWTSEVDPQAFPAGLVPNLVSDWYALDSTLPRGPMRGGHDVVNAFAVGGFIDEIAAGLKRDPVDVYHQLLDAGNTQTSNTRSAYDTERLRAVLDLAADRIDWKKPRYNGHGLGIACHAAYGGYCAHAFEVSVRGDRLRIHRAVCAIDVGRIVNPTGLKAQASGGTLFAIGTALGQAITVTDGQVQQDSLRSYPLADIAQLPDTVDVYPVSSEASPGGASPVAVPSAVPALANAVHAATTVRIRHLPLMPELMRLI